MERFMALTRIEELKRDIARKEDELEKALEYKSRQFQFHKELQDEIVRLQVKLEVAEAEQQVEAEVLWQTLLTPDWKLAEEQLLVS